MMNTSLNQQQIDILAQMVREAYALRCELNALRGFPKPHIFPLAIELMTAMGYEKGRILEELEHEHLQKDIHDRIFTTK